LAAGHERWDGRVSCPSDECPRWRPTLALVSSPDAARQGRARAVRLWRPNSSWPIAGRGVGFRAQRRPASLAATRRLARKAFRCRSCVLVLVGVRSSWPLAPPSGLSIADL